MSSTRNEDIQPNQNASFILSPYEYESQFVAHYETTYSESSISFTSKVELKHLRDPIASRVTLVSNFISQVITKCDVICVIFRFILMEV